MFFALASGLIGLCALIGSKNESGGTVCSITAALVYSIALFACDFWNCPYPEGQLVGIGAILVVIAVTTVIWIVTPRKCSLDYTSYHSDPTVPHPTGASPSHPDASRPDQER
jgi:hypothetical protein